MRLVAVFCLLVLAACEPKAPQIAGSAKVVENAAFPAIAQAFMRLKREGFVPDRDLILAFSGEAVRVHVAGRTRKPRGLPARARRSRISRSCSGSRASGRGGSRNLGSGDEGLFDFCTGSGRVLTRQFLP